METERPDRQEPVWTAIRQFVAGNWSWLFFAISIGAGLFALYFVMTGGSPNSENAWEKILYYFIPAFGFVATLVVFVTVLWRDNRKGKP